MEFTTLVMSCKDKERAAKRETEFLGRSVRFKIAPRVGLALNIHKQGCQLMTKHKMFEGKMTNYLSHSLLKIELVRLLSIWEKL